MNKDNTMPVLVAFSAKLLMRTYHNNPLTISNTKSLKHICGNFTFEPLNPALNLHREKFTLEKIVPQGLIGNTESKEWVFWVNSQYANAVYEQRIGRC